MLDILRTSASAISRHRRLVFAGAVVATLVIGFVVVKQRALPQKSKIHGSVKNRNGRALPNTDVQIISDNGKLVTETQTDQSGRFSIEVPEGHYMVRAARSDTIVGTESATAFAEKGFETKIILAPHVRSTTGENLGTPVYNALFWPTTEKGPAHLISGAKTTLNFYIGLPAAEPSLQSPVNPQLLRMKGVVPLTVMLSCPVCASRQLDTRVITFYSDLNESSETTFDVVPSTRFTKNGAGVITFDVYDGATKIDHFAIAVNVEKAGTRPAEASTFIRSRRDAITPAEVPEIPQPDLVITLAKDVSGLSIQFRPLHPGLAAALAGRDLENNVPRWFAVRGISLEAIEDAERDLAMTLRGIADPSDPLFSKALKAIPNGPVQVSLQGDHVSLTPQDGDAVVSMMRRLGSYIYTGIFAGNRDVFEIVKVIESFHPAPGAALHIVIHSGDIHFPWQFLYPPGSKGADLFWGFRYAIAIDTSERPYDGVLPETLTFGDPPALLITYKEEITESPAVSQNAKEQAEHLKLALKLSSYATAQSSVTLLDQLKKEKSSLGFILVYTHASMGKILLDLDGHIVIQDEWPGPRFILSKDRNNIVRPLDLDELRVDGSDPLKPYFSHGPIVLLNACETGTSSIGNLQALSFPAVLIALGSRGVIATESPVWPEFAKVFGNDVIDKLASGKKISEGLLNVRQKYWHDNHNPFGLLYSYYGDETFELTSR